MKKVQNLLERMQARKNELAEEDGFTLMEVVLTVAIVLILSIGGFLAYNGIQDNARESTAQSVATQLVTGIVAADATEVTTADREAAAAEVIAEYENEAVEYNITASDSGIEVKTQHTGGGEPQTASAPGDYGHLTSLNHTGITE